MRLFAFVLLIAGTPLACIAQSAKDAPKPFTLVPGLDRTVMDTTADPCDDFYQYACGNWARQHPIPADAPYSDQFYNLQQVNLQVLRTILEKAAAAKSTPGSNEQKIGDYYATCIDESLVNTPVARERGMNPAGQALLQTELHRISMVQTKQDLAPYLAHAQLIGDTAFFSFGKMQDFQDTTRDIAVVQQVGLGLPERNYYLRDGAKDREIREQYLNHVRRMLTLAGEPAGQADRDADTVLQMETALARASLDATTLRDPQKNYHLMPRGDLKKLAPELDWSIFLDAIGAPAFTHLNIAQPEFLIGMNTVLRHEQMPEIRAYLRWHLLNATAGVASPRALDDENFDFYARKLTGIPQQEPRWKRCTAAVDTHLGEALGRVYAEQEFSQASKARAQEMIRNIEAAMASDLQSLDWMSPATKAEAQQKLHLIANKVGYPEKWRDYSGLKIFRGDPLGNTIRATEFENRRQIAEIGRPVDRGEWFMTPPTVNAYYDPSMNDINFPAGVLQLAFFDPASSDALNYGHIGLFMGHEITHGFDDQGRQFDGHGKLRDWWTKEDADKFSARAQCLVDEYGQFQATEDTHLNGKLTLGENTADNGGLRLAFVAYVAAAERDRLKVNKKVKGGYTSEQEFFLGFAQDWCAAWRPELERLIATTDPHSPDRFRANGVLVNFPEFATAFGCKAGSRMVAAKACRVW